MHFLEQVPIPTPTEALDKAVEAVNDNIVATQKLVESVGNLTALGVIALIVVLGILYVIFVARKRSTDNDTLKLQATQTAALITQMQKDREERGDLLKRLFDRDEQRENRTIESISALTAAQEANRAVVAEVKAIAVSFNSREIQTAAMLEKMANEGSEPVKAIRTNTDHILKLATDILSAVQNLSAVQVTKEEFNTSITELKLTISALRGVVENAEKRKTDSQPVTTIAVDATPTPQVNLGATS